MGWARRESMVGGTQGRVELSKGQEDGKQLNGGGTGTRKEETSGGWSGEGARHRPGADGRRDRNGVMYRTVDGQRVDHRD